ncbi:MAG: hypothetical protein U0359_34720 [Byssovorax sp.]
MRVAAALALSLLLGTAGCAEGGVVRVLDGREVLGRFIPDEAYAAYAEGEERAARGEVAEALASFERAARFDPESAEIWTRVGAIACKRSAAGRGASSADEAFRKAEAIDPTFAPLYRERARCYRDGEPDRDEALKDRAARLAAALTASERAVALDGADVEASAIRASLLREAHRGDEARRLLEALIIRRPASAEAHLALYELARAAGDEALAERAGLRVIALSPRLAPRIEGELPALAPLARLDTALRADDLAEAERLAHRIHLPLVEVALRAVALGRVTLAKHLAEALAGAAPDDRAAQLTLILAADLGGDTATLDRTALPARGPALPLLAQLLFAELLDRRVGPEAARLWLGEAPAPPAGDALVTAVNARLRKRLEGSSARVAAPVP